MGRIGRVQLEVGISKAHLAAVTPRAVAKVDARAAEKARTEIDLQRQVARELHDQVAQPLIDLVLDVGVLRRQERPVADADLARVEDAARQVLRQAREMLIDLRGQGELRVNFVQDLNSKVEVSGATKSNIEVSSRWPRRINGWAAFNLLRIVQQAVANAQRHGRAKKIDIFLGLGAEGDAVLVVLDDGIGIDPAQRGFGMVGMQERAEILGGKFSVQRRETGGTRIEVRVPLERLG